MWCPDRPTYICEDAETAEGLPFPHGCRGLLVSSAAQGFDPFLLKFWAHLSSSLLWICWPASALKPSSWKSLRKSQISSSSGSISFRLKKLSITLLPSLFKLTGRRLLHHF